MDLDKVIFRGFVKAMRKPAVKKKKKKVAPEVKHRENIRKLLRLVRTGDLNLERKSHKILYTMAVREGYITKDLQILMEI